MNLTPEYLGDLRRQADGRRAALVVQVHEADGVLALIDVLLARLAEPDPGEGPGGLTPPAGADTESHEGHA